LPPLVADDAAGAEGATDMGALKDATGVVVRRRRCRSRTAYNMIIAMARLLGSLAMMLLVMTIPAMAVALSSSCNSWGSLEKALPSAASPSAVGPKVVDSVLTRNEPTYSSDVLTLFRERNGWCPYSQRVWLGLESKGVPFDTVLIDNMGERPGWYRGTTPQVRWSDGRTEDESLDILRALDDEFPDAPPLYPPGREEEVERLCGEFRKCFPKGTRPSSRAAFLFRSGGANSPVFRGDFEAALDATDALLAEASSGGRGGPFFLGDTFSAADCAWAPFLERYASQLPLLHKGLDPRRRDDEVGGGDDGNGKRWPHVVAWFDAMESAVPGYCRCQGDGWSWAKVLTSAGFGNAGAPPPTLQEQAARAARQAVAAAEAHEQASVEAAALFVSSPSPSSSDEGGAAVRRVAEAHRNWADYASASSGRARAPVEEATPAGGAARLLVARREALAKDAVRSSQSSSSSTPQFESEDSALRGLLLVATALQKRHELQRRFLLCGSTATTSDAAAATAAAASIPTVAEEAAAAVAACVASEESQVALRYLAGRICVPRDMGRLPALEIRRLEAALSLSAEGLEIN
jgi:glutathione S-transferase